MRKFDEEQFLSGVEIKVLDLVLTKDPSRKRDFLEVRFGLTLRHLVRKELARFRDSAARTVPFPAGYANIDSEDGPTDVARQLGRLRDPAASPEEALLSHEAESGRLRRLRNALNKVTDPRHREAVILHYGHGLPIASSVRGKECLTRHFRKKPWQIKYWLRTAMKQMRGERL